jgi:hypothetical protein
MAASYPDLLAHGIAEEGRFDPFQLYSGSGPWNTTAAQAADGQAIVQFQVLGLDASHRLVPFDPAALTPMKVYGIAAQPVDASTPGGMVPVFVSGGFNHEALVWDAALDTLAERKAVFASTPMYVQQVL